MYDKNNQRAREETLKFQSSVKADMGGLNKGMDHLYSTQIERECFKPDNSLCHVEKEVHNFGWLWRNATHQLQRKIMFSVT